MSFQAIIEELLAATRSSRTTLRLDRPGEDFPVVAEALAPGVRSIAGDLSFPIRSAETVKHLERERRILLQRDLLGVEPAPAPELIEHYGARAQMLAPVVQGRRFVGIVSVHHAGGPRDWTQPEIAALERAAARIEAELAAR